MNFGVTMYLLIRTAKLINFIIQMIIVQVSLCSSVFLVSHPDGAMSVKLKFICLIYGLVIGYSLNLNICKI